MILETTIIYIYIYTLYCFDAPYSIFFRMAIVMKSLRPPCRPRTPKPRPCKAKAWGEKVLKRKRHLANPEPLQP